MSSWANRTRRKELEHIRTLNQVSMTAAGFQPDPGRKLTQEEIGKINLTQPSEIRDCGFKPEYYWR
jgi:hypothetical protein